MGCGSSTAALPLNNFSPSEKDLSDRDANGVYESSLSTVLYVQSAGPELARASWRLTGLSFEEAATATFILEMDSGGAGESFVEVFRGAGDSHLVQVEPGSSLRLRACALRGGDLSEWSNEVHFCTQAVVPRRPEPPSCTFVAQVATINSTPSPTVPVLAYQVSWAMGRNGGLPIECYDVQMETYDASQAEDLGAGVWMAGNADCSSKGSTISSVYSGKDCAVLVRDDQGTLAGARVRFRMQARNAMGYSEWSSWSTVVGEGENPLEEEGTEESAVWPHGISPLVAVKVDTSVSAPSQLLIEHAPELTNMSPYDLLVSWETCKGTYDLEQVCFLAFAHRGNICYRISVLS